MSPAVLSKVQGPRDLPSALQWLEIWSGEKPPLFGSRPHGCPSTRNNTHTHTQVSRNSFGSLSIPFSNVFNLTLAHAQFRKHNFEHQTSRDNLHVANFAYERRTSISQLQTSAPVHHGNSGSVPRAAAVEVCRGVRVVFGHGHSAKDAYSTYMVCKATIEANVCRMESRHNTRLADIKRFTTI